MDPVELRALNMVKPHELPWVNPVGAIYDSGDYEQCLRMAADAVDWAGHRRAEFFGCDYDGVTVHAGDTAASPLNTGAFASRTVIAAAGALLDACARLRAKTLRIAAHMLGVADPEQLDVIGRAVQHRDDLTLMVPLSGVFQRAILGQGLPEGEMPGLDETSYFDPPDAAYSFGTAAAIVAVDAESGEFAVERFLMVHDCGTPLNPKPIEGQVRGGLAQGLGQALAEELVYDPETGQLVNGTMMDYFAPTACDLPSIEPICDALSDFGVELDRLPITPERVWQALRGKVPASA